MEQYAPTVHRRLDSPIELRQGFRKLESLLMEALGDIIECLPIISGQLLTATADSPHLTWSRFAANDRVGMLQAG